MAKKRTFKEFKQGIYKPNNSEKCLNRTPIVYRSMLECRTFRFFDNSPSVLKWGSELFPIQYMKGDKPARYWVDIYAEMKIGDEVKKFIFEVKPEKQTISPKPSKNKKRSTVVYEQTMWYINNQKWDAARAWAIKNGLEFKIITEKDVENLEGRK